MQVPFQGNPPCQVQELTAAHRPGVAGRGRRHSGQMVVEAGVRRLPTACLRRGV